MLEPWLTEYTQPFNKFTATPCVANFRTANILLALARCAPEPDRTPPNTATALLDYFLRRVQPRPNSTMRRNRRTHGNAHAISVNTDKADSPSVLMN